MGTAGTEGAAPRASPASPLALGRVMSNAARGAAQQKEEMSYALAAARRTEKRRMVAFVTLCDAIVASTLREMLVAAAESALRLVQPDGTHLLLLRLLPCSWRCNSVVDCSWSRS